MHTEPLPPQHIQGFAEVAAQLAGRIGAVVLGKAEVVRLALTALFAQGHDDPGPGAGGLDPGAVAADPVHA